MTENNPAKLEIMSKQLVERAQKYSERNTVDTTNGRACVDGRYDESGPLARAGGDFGYVMGLLALRRHGVITLSPQECVDAVYGAVTKNGGKFFLHTDTHATESNALTGCGHAGKAANPETADDYDTNPEDVKLALEHVRSLSANGKVVETVLEGDHEEEGVMVVKGDKKTIAHKEDGQMYFIYDADRDASFQKGLVDSMNIENVTNENFKAALDKQTQATLKHLAKDKPIFEITYEENDPKAILAGFV